MAQVKKISVATVCGKIKLSELMAAPEKTVKLMRVFGRAVGIKQGLSNFGEWTALQGSFKAINLADGASSEAAVCFLPDVALIPIQTALSASAGVDFAIEISAVYVAEKEGHKAGGSPYEYTFTPLLATSNDDPVARLEAAYLATLPQLSAPEVPANTPDTVTPETKKGKK